MLKIQEFINAHDNWRELLAAAPYNLKISEEDGFVLFKYNQISSDFNEEICREARGLILDTQDNFRVVRYAFRKFFNIDESYAAKLDWDTAVATEKIDGSIMSVWYARGQWHLSTNGCIDAFKAELNGVGPYKTFGELFESVLPLSWFDNVISNRIAYMCYTFELVSPYNRVVIDYPETKVYLLSVRNMNTLVEYPLDEVAEFAKRFNLTMPQFYYMNDEDGFRRLVEQMPEGHEGIVVRDENGERVKIKTLLYFNLHKMRNNGQLTVERIVELIRANDHEEYLSYFPQDKPYFDKIRQDMRNVEGIVEKVRQAVAYWKANNPDAPRKWFAQDFATAKFTPLYFAEYDGKTKQMLDNMTTEKFIKFFEIGKEVK